MTSTRSHAFLSKYKLVAFETPFFNGTAVQVDLSVDTLRSADGSNSGAQVETSETGGCLHRVGHLKEEAQRLRCQQVGNVRRGAATSVATLEAFADVVPTESPLRRRLGRPLGRCPLLCIHVRHAPHCQGYRHESQPTSYAHCRKVRPRSTFSCFRKWRTLTAKVNGHQPIGIDPLCSRSGASFSRWTVNCMPLP